MASAVAAMAAHGADVEVARRGCGVLRNLTRDADAAPHGVARAVVEGGGVGRAVAAMGAHVSDLEVCVRAAWVHRAAPWE